MGSFLLYEIRNVLRLEGYEVTKHSNRRVICNLLNLKKDSSLSDICKELNMSYIKREGEFNFHEGKSIFLLSLDSKNVQSFKTLTEASKSLGINLSYDNDRLEKSILEKIIFVKGERAVLSFSETTDRRQDFERCLVNKININLALSTKLEYTVDYKISIPEIFSLLGEEIRSHRLKERLCQLLEIPYFFERKLKNNKRKKVLARSEDEKLYFHSLSSAAKFFQVSSSVISRVIKFGYRFPLWYKRYTLEYV